MTTHLFEEVMQFWLPDGLDRDQTSLVRQWAWWFRNGADADIVERFSPLLEQAHRELLEFSAEQARRHREVIARFGRHPHRNQVLGRNYLLRSGITSQLDSLFIPAPCRLT